MRKLLPLAIVATLLACSDDPSGDSQETSTASDATSASTSGPPKARPLVPPDEVKNILAAVPAKASVVVSVPALSALPIPKETYDQVLPLVLPDLAKESGLAEATLRGLVEGFDGGAGFGVGDLEKDAPIAVALRFKDGKVVEDAINELKLEKKAAGQYTLKKGDTTAHLQWLPKPRVLIVSRTEAGVTEALDALSGKSQSFADSTHAKLAVENRLFVFGDLHGLLKNEEGFAAGSLVAMSMGADDSELVYKQLGAKVPRISQVLGAVSHDGLGKLPDKPIVAVDLSLARPAGKSIKDFFTELGRASGSDLTPALEQRLALLGLTVADLDAALGDSLTMGAYVPDSPVADPSQLADKGVLLFALPVKDDAVAKKVFDAMKKIGAGDKTLKFTENRVTVDIGKGKGGLVELTPGMIIAAGGDKAFADKLVASYKKGTTTLGSNAAFTDAKKKATPSQLALVFDYDQLMKSVPQDAPFKVPAMFTGYGYSDLVLNPSDQGIDGKISGAAAVPLIGVGGALAVYGVRRYLQSAKASEAKNSIGAISRGAVGAFERERTGANRHALCKSSTGVPATVQAGTKYQPDMAAGKDFETGDDDTGWKCLKFTITNPIYYKYEYRAGSGYKCPARGGKDPGPDGFEASAEGDLDGDGKTSLFCLTGKVNKATETVVVDTEMFIVDEFE